MIRNRMMAGPRLNALIDEVVFYRGYTGNDYSGDPLEAWKIVELIDPQRRFSPWHGRGAWHASFELPWDSLLDAETPALAICYAALQWGFWYDNMLLSPHELNRKMHEWLVGLSGFDRQLGTSNLDLWEEVRRWKQERSD